MTPYFVLLWLVVLIAYVGRRRGSIGVRRLSIGIIVVVLVLFGGLRDRSVGTDTENYIGHLLRANSFDDIWRTTEIGYNALMLLSASLSDDYAIFLIVIALIVVGSYVAGIVRMTRRYETALFLFITLGAYTFFFNGARQGIAAALCFLALPFLLERRLTPYLTLIGVAALFHHTALIAAPLYYLARPHLGWKQLTIVLIGAIGAVAFLSVIVELAAVLIDEKYAVYAVAGEGGGKVMTAFLVAQGLILYLFKNQVSDDEECYARLLNIYLIGLIPVLASTLSSVNPSGLLRLHTYFSHTAILLWPILFFSWRSTPSRLLISMGLLVVSIVYFGLTTSSFGDIVPYQMNSKFVW